MNKARVAQPGGPIIFLLLAVLLVASGCASAPSTARFGLYPAGEPAKGYSTSVDTWIYRDDELLVTLRGYTPGPYASSTEEKLYARGYVLLALSIKNLSGKRVIYNPAGTSLRDDTMGYKKPLDFTNLYDMAAEEEKLGGLGGFSKRFYDLSVTIMPGEKTERLLAFRPLDRKARKAMLVVKGVYVGTGVVDLGFDFELEAADED